ncbi:MAG: S41 family peptidase, partial [Patescibacteria group bacterium]
KTFGKGSVQELINLPNNASLKVTIARWLTPNGTEINGNGLEVDRKVLVPEKPEEGRDYYIDTAIEMLKSR